VKLDRVAALVGKELREFRASPTAVLPVAILMIVAMLLPFLILYLIPRMTGQSLTSDRSLQEVVAAARTHLPGLAALDAEDATRSFFLQQFLLLFLLTPVVGAVSLAAYSVVGEKQGRTLEPLLATPISTTELLVAKVLASFLPALAAEIIGVAGFFFLVRAFGSPAVAHSLLTARTVILLGVLGPFGALAALQGTIAVSSRVNDPRSAQQIAILVVLPVAFILVGQIAGAFFLTIGMLLAASVVMAAVWVLLIMLSVALFERESILTRWK
jgi:ABC-2 type transport system permease protein